MPDYFFEFLSKRFRIEATMTGPAQFDDYSENYNMALAEGLSITGEDKEFFARQRIAWLARCIKKLHVQPKAAIDFGCGIGSATPYLFDLLGVESVLGVDVSPRCLEVARQTWGSERSQFALLNQYKPSEQFDLAFCNGVFHHIAPDNRAGAVSFVYSSLRPGALFALWENNPWNPGTRYIMSRCPFDKDAVMLTPPEARRMLGAAGFEILSTSFMFIFPRALAWLRGIEPLVSGLPIGGQYQVLCRKP
jgi:SAM-dependent methyltransferase